MTLTKYKQKRNFKKTSEPIAGKASGGKHIFVVQRHHASHLHYDLRLEVNGVLKSWAVPKGPSLFPEDKRLAMEVEDHPYDYKDFEGEIPPGNYGAGYVHVWDKGTYELLEDEGGDFDKTAIKHWKAGSLKIILHGKKLKGEFALVKMKGRQENAWLLIKHKDRYAAKAPYNSEDHTPKRIKDKLKGPHNSPVASKKKPAPEREAAARGKQKMKKWYHPMMTTLVDAPFDREGWIFEPKWDGYRAIAAVENGKAELYSRNQLSFNEIYPSVVTAVENIPHNVVLDGEVVVRRTGDRSDFQALQNFGSTRKGKITYVVFDLLHLDGHDLVSMTLLERKALLKQVVEQLNDPSVRYSSHMEGKGLKLFEKAEKMGWEGIIAKNGESEYLEGTRGMEWLKIKILQRQEVVICGYTDPRGSRKKMGALILGIYENRKLKYAGHCGGGFNHEMLDMLYKRFQAYRQEASPFDEQIKTNAPVSWMKPALVCEVKFSEWTGDGYLRQPVFVGMREDKPASQVKRELPKHIEMKATIPSKTSARKSATSSTEDTRSLRLGSHTVNFTNQQKLYWPKEKITKGQLIDYYISVADYMLPHLKDRPQSLHRFPDGIDGMSFYQKDLDVKNIPSWLKTVPIYSESNDKEIDYLICNNVATLAWMANLGCIEINPWLSRTGKPDHPDYVVIDLDPEDIAFRHVVDTANCVHDILEEYGIQSYCKTSGASGLHVYIPTGAKYNYDTCRLFAEFIARETNARLPEVTSVIRAKSKRKKKVYVDFLQNSRGQTVAAPYSVRPRPGASVSTPLFWEEVTPKLNVRDFHIGNTVSRLKEYGDLWKDISSQRNNFRAVLKKQE